jgi:hypothetical protein
MTDFRPINVVLVLKEGFEENYASTKKLKSHAVMA